MLIQPVRLNDDFDDLHLAASEIAADLNKTDKAWDTINALLMLLNNRHQLQLVNTINGVINTSQLIYCFDELIANNGKSILIAPNRRKCNVVLPFDINNEPISPTLGKHALVAIHHTGGGIYELWVFSGDMELTVTRGVSLSNFKTYTLGKNATPESMLLSFDSFNQDKLLKETTDMYSFFRRPITQFARFPFINPKSNILIEYKDRLRFHINDENIWSNTDRFQEDTERLPFDWFLTHRRALFQDTHAVSLLSAFKINTHTVSAKSHIGAVKRIKALMPTFDDNSINVLMISQSSNPSPKPIAMLCILIVRGHPIIYYVDSNSSNSKLKVSQYDTHQLSLVTDKYLDQLFSNDGLCGYSDYSKRIKEDSKANVLYRGYLNGLCEFLDTFYQKSSTDWFDVSTLTSTYYTGL